MGMDEARDGHGMVPEQAAAFLLFAELSSPASVPPGGGERGKERVHSGSAGHKADREIRRTEGSRTRSGLTWGRSRWAHERTKRKGRVFVRFCVGETAGRSEWEKGNRICLAGLLGGRKRLRLLVGRGARGARRC